jgi:hypothetical protein
MTSAQARRDRKLTEMWNQGLKSSVIATCVGFNRDSSVSHAAKRLGLAPRKRIRNIEGALRANRERQVRGAAQQLARCEEAERREKRCGQNEKADQPTPTMWRCPCGQICVTGPYHEGHEVKVA